MLKFYNTLSKVKETFVPLNPNNIRMYVCGPTVYDHIHIGNARPIVVFDSIFRLLKILYPKVTYVRNITDIDDKIINKANENKESIESLTTRTTKDFHNEIAKLNCLMPTYEPHATDHIKEMQDIIATLIDEGFAYVVKGHVFFAVNKYLEYGSLSGFSQNDIMAGARVEISDLKQHVSDFILWKPAKEGEPSYQSPWDFKGGRPGWHIECSAMARKYLGDNFDIHGGGVDLIFPHHENERAQSICFCNASAKKNHKETSVTNSFANYWLHNGFLMVEGQKMSKSLGNFITLNEANKKYNGEVIRLTLLATHYRQPLDFKQDALKQFQSVLKKFYDVLLPYEDVKVNSTLYEEEFLQALKDDFNVPKSLTVLHKIINALYAMKNNTKDSKDTVETLKSKIINCGNLLGILFAKPSIWLKENHNSREKVEDITDLEVEEWLNKRDSLKQQKKYQEADEIRNFLLARGITIEDRQGKTDWKRK